MGWYGMGWDESIKRIEAFDKPIANARWDAS
jgi:hypothetical protein